MMQKCNVKQNKINTKNLLNANNNSRNKIVLFHTRAMLSLFVVVNLDESATMRLLLVYQYFLHIFIVQQIRVITKLPNSEQSYKGKVKTHKYINRQNQSTTGKL
jgi:hypothetical protein